MMNSNNNGQIGDTSKTKVFVGGLAWETEKEALRQHFEKYGEIIEAVIISDKVTGRSKGYGFVTFKEAEAANKACHQQDQQSLVINGRRANCNLASLGARRPRTCSTPISDSSPQPKGAIRNNASSTPANNNNKVQWYYPLPLPNPNANANVNANASPFYPPPHHALPYYGYTPTYIATDINNYHYNYNYNYNQKMSYGGAYMSGHHLSHVYPRHAMVGANTMMPMYPLYHYNHHPTETMGVPAHYFNPTVVMPAGHYAAVPAGIVSKPVSMTPHTGTVGGVECFKAVV